MSESEKGADTLQKARLRSAVARVHAGREAAVPLPAGARRSVATAGARART